MKYTVKDLRVDFPDEEACLEWLITWLYPEGVTCKVCHVKSAGARVVQPLIRKHVKHGTMIHTDGYLAYRKLPQMGYRHRWTDHGKMEFWREDSYTQNIENVWSTMKPRWKGTFKHISAEYLQAYADEFAWRYSHRHSISVFWSLMCRINNSGSSD
jgi:transposase-like protein